MTKRLFHFDLDNGIVCDQEGLILIKVMSTTNRLDLDEKGCLRPIGLILIKGVSATNRLDLDERGVCDQQS